MPRSRSNSSKSSESKSKSKSAYVTPSREQRKAKKLFVTNLD